MKARFSIFILICLFLISCAKDDLNKFDESADQRVARAIKDLKDNLTAPSNGWKLKYNPVSGTGSYHVLLDFDENNKVRIRTDLGVNDGEFYDQTITYRIDNSLGLELIFENYSFFSFLFEQDQATFGGEFEFNYVNQTPDGLLVFSSKTDGSNPTILSFQPATEADQALLGVDLSNNLNELADDLDKYSSSLILTFDNKDLAFYLSINPAIRTVEFNYVSLKSNNQNGQALTFSTGYVVEGNMLVLDNTLSGNFVGQEISIKSIQLNTLSESTLAVCSTPIEINSYKGIITSSNDPVTLQTTLFDIRGQKIASNANFLYSPIQYITENGVPIFQDLTSNIKGVMDMQLYLDNNPNDPFYAIGFRVQNSNGTTSWLLREFVPTFEGNNLKFQFAAEVEIFGDENPDADKDSINQYLDKMAEGGNTYIFQYFDRVYEIYNPCNGWNAIFVAPN